MLSSPIEATVMLSKTTSPNKLFPILFHHTAHCKKVLCVSHSFPYLLNV